MEPLDIGETSSALARRWSGEWRGSFAGVLSMLVAAATGAGVAGWIVTRHSWRSRRGNEVRIVHWPGAIQVIVPIGCALLVAILVLAVVHANYLVKAPRSQRDEARQRLRDVKKAIETITLMPTDASVKKMPGATGSPYVFCTVKNVGRMAQFAVTIDSVEGAEAELQEPHVNLLWWDRPGTIVEEIPPGESRPIVVGTIRRLDRQLHFRSVSPTGVHREPASASSGDITVWFRVSLRNQPEMSYTRKVGVVIGWPDGGLPAATLAPDPPDVETSGTAASFASLLDFGPSRV